MPPALLFDSLAAEGWRYRLSCRLDARHDFNQPMRIPTLLTVMALGLSSAATIHAQAPVDSSLAAFIARIRAVDNHTHANSVAPVDSEADALPLDGLPAFALPERLKPDGPPWIAAYRALYGYRYDDLSEPHITELRAAMRRVASAQGTQFPEWALDKIGTEVMIANRIAMGPGLTPPRFRWASYVDALMLPLSTRREAARSPDYRALYPLEDRLLRRYMKTLAVAKLPPTLEAYLRLIVTPVLERQRKEGCIAVKFEAAYLRALDFDDPSEPTARRVYARYAAGGEPTHAEYKALQDYLFRYIARDAGRLGMAVHIHSFEGAGGYYHTAGSDPLLLEPAFNDSTLRGTNFVIVHGGGMYVPRALAMLWKPNVYLDISLQSIIGTPATLAPAVRNLLTQFPGKILFGTDAFGGGPDAGWELAAWIGTTTARKTLAVALTGMLRDGEISRARAQEIATMVLRQNANTLYKLGLELSPLTALRFGALADPSGRTISDAVIIVQADTILRVGIGASAIPAGARVVDLRRYTAIPGMIDVHTHMTYWRDKSTPTANGPRSKDSVVMAAAENARKTLETGVTTVRDLGASNYTDIAMRDSIDKGVMLGPRMFVAGYGLSKVTTTPRAGTPPGAPRGRVQDTLEIKDAIKAQIDAGADWIKMYGSTGSFQNVTGQQTFTDVEMRVATETAHRYGKPIAIHSYGDSGGRAAMRAGAESVEHAAGLSDATFAEWIKRGTVYVPTIDHNRFYAENASLLGFTAEQVAGLDSFRLLNLETARRAHKAGVTLAMGSDAVYWMFGENTRELGWFVKAGMTPAQALATATTNAAALLRMPTKLGAIAPGYFADIVAVEGDPMRDIDVVINRVKWVMKGGVVVVDKTAP